MDERRVQRVSEALREELSEIIAYEMSDPRLGDVDVTEVLLSPDMRLAQVRVALQGSPEERRESLEALDHARGFLRRAVAKRLELFRMPELRFEADVDLGPQGRVDNLLKRIKKGRPKPVEGDQEPDEAESQKKSPANET